MKTTKIGIWMDHQNANVMEFTAEGIKSVSSNHVNANTSGNNENLRHNKEQHQQLEYYKELGEVIKNYDEAILFGPTDAKVELLNILKADHRFEKIKIEVEQADKMTENQQHAFVSSHFSRT